MNRFAFKNQLAHGGSKFWVYSCSWGIILQGTRLSMSRFYALYRYVCSSSLTLSNHAWVSFQGFAEAYNVALDVPKDMGMKSELLCLW